MSELLVVEDLEKSFKDGPRELNVLKGINLEVERGGLIAITGPSGAGKSTLLHLLGGLDKPTDGKIYLNGTDIYRLSNGKLANLRNRQIGFVFQFFYLLPEFSVFENVSLPAMISGRMDKERVSQLLKRVGLSERIRHRPDQISAGEMQRAAIARALVNNPEIVFADEPTGNLDRDNSISIMNLIRELNEEDQQTFVIATHDDKLAREAKKVLSMVNGKLSQAS
jgi:ABC-type lipoprotein export system ATPase subunit